MHMALSTDEWLSQKALYCNRYHARLTPVHCEENRQRTADSRCSGCDGLEEQPRELEQHEPVVFYSDPESDELDPSPMIQALAGALQEVLDGYEEELPPDDQGDPEGNPRDELTGFERELLALLGDNLDEPIFERKRAKEGPRRFAVFIGRCPRCKGFMVNAPERYNDNRDDDVHRCFTCGYRTSPGYQWNRQQGA